MDLKTIVISAAVGVIASAITAYITTRLKVKEEREKWRKEFAIRYADIQATDQARAQNLAVQFAIGVLIKNPESEERDRIFIPPNCRLIAGRAPDSAIHIDDVNLSRHHCAFDADDENVFVEVLGSVSISSIKEEPLRGKRLLQTEDIITIGRTRLRFHKLESR